ncbi:MAG TPA: hypothetical protein VM033_00325 [Gemmatimonadaceae bacterium]|nr:hypothetical protein [Gemmatimonadaceae bacterium]
MRLRSRVAGLLALAMAAITCTDAATGPGTLRPGFHAARLVLAPSFSTSAARAYGALEAMGISVTQVRIRLRAADGMMARDTTIQFGVSDTLHIRIPVEIRGTEQTFSALIELMDATGRVLFSQTQDVLARASTLPPAPPPTITLEYVGPGASARSITVTPRDLVVPAGVEPVLTAAGTDAGGAPVTELLLAWTSSDTTLATITAVGAVATVHGTGRRGTVTITAAMPTGLAGTARLSMLPLAARLLVISGDAQSSLAGRLLAQPLVVELQGADGGPIPGAAVTFGAITSGASVGTAMATTDATGRTSTTLVLGRTAGAYSFEAASVGVPPVTITATATPLPAVALSLVSGDAQSDVAGLALALPFVVRAIDEFGGVVRGATVEWTRVAGIGSLAAPSTVSDSLGLARAGYTLGVTPSVDTIRALLPGTSPAATVLFTARSVAGAAAKLLFETRAPDTITVGVAFAPVRVRLADGLGNAVRSAGVMVRVVGTGVTPDTSAYRDSTLTDSAGIATFTIPAYRGLIGTLQLTLSSTGLASAGQSLVAKAGAPAGLVVVKQPPPGATSGVPFVDSVIVQLVDAGRNAVPGVVTTTASLLGAGTLGGITTAATDASGRVSFGSLVITGLVGSYSIHVASGALTPATSAPIALSAGAAAIISSVAGDKQTALVGLATPTAPTVLVKDASGNPVGGVSVGFAVTAGGGSVAVGTVVTDAAGMASTVWTLGVVSGANALSVTAAGLSGSPVGFGATALAGPATALTFAVVPKSATSGTVMAPDTEVQLLDAYGNAASGAGVAVTIALVGNGTLSGVLTATTDATGRARFPGLVIVGTVSLTYSLAASAPGLKGATSTPIPLL